MLIFVRFTQNQASQNPSRDGGGALQAPPVSQEVLTAAVEGESFFFFEGVATGRFSMLQWTALQS